MNKLTIAIFAVIGVFLYFGLRYKKRKEAELNERFLRMEKEGDFKGMKQMFGKMAIIWCILAFLILAVSVVRSFSDVRTAVPGFVLSVIFGRRTFELARRWSAYRNLEKKISYRLSAQEVEEFWKQDNDAVFEGLYDYTFKKSYMEDAMEMLNEKEKMIYALA